MYATGYRPYARKCINYFKEWLLMGTALAFFLFYEGSYLFFAYLHPHFRTFEIQPFEMQKTAPWRGFLPKYLFGFPRMAGLAGFEPTG